ncbi:hypothetical protein F8M41_020912 [Gigaspora margarita]|uniref:SWIM-type domain-containing protein n=1 Tax=Gigaspora margarita TaxID=4874 RepID=A0A8H4EJ86_GIGMA|nr:hypothetical protein F8M41_020912 [Gigaspora margarita]
MEGPIEVDEDRRMELYESTARSYRNDFRAHQLPCKHVFAILNCLQISKNEKGNVEKDNQSTQSFQQLIESEVPSSSSTLCLQNNFETNYEFVKLQEELTAIAEE